MGDIPSQMRALGILSISAFRSDATIDPSSCMLKKNLGMPFPCLNDLLALPITTAVLYDNAALCNCYPSMQVLNLTTYPHLMGFLDALSVETEESEMSFSLSMDMGKVEWASHSLGTIFAQRENLWKASFWHMIWDVVKFGRQAPKVTLQAKIWLCIWRKVA